MNRFRPYLPYIRPFFGPLLLSLLFAGIYAAASGGGIPGLVNYVFPKIFGGHNHLTTWQLLGYASLIPLLFVIRGVSGYWNTYIVNHCSISVLEKIRNDLFTKLQRLPLSYFDRNSSGDLISRMMADTLQVQQTLTSVGNDIIKQPLTLIFALGYLAWLAATHNGVVYFVLYLSVIPICVFPVRAVGKNLLRRAMQTQSKMGAVSDRVSENIQAAREVRAFGLENRQIDSFTTSVRDLFRVQMKVVKYSNILSPIIEIISSFGIGLSFIYAYKAGLTWNVFFTILTALFMCYDPLKRTGAVHNQLQRGLGAVERIEEVLNEIVSIRDPDDPVAIDHVDGNIRFSNVDFSYTDTPTLSSVSAEIPAGTVCALVGPSGAGKSTFANLVPRFYEVTAGSVSIDDIDIRRMRQADLRRQIAVVSQDPVLFNTSIEDNIRIGRWDSSPAEIREAARRAFAHDFITSMPDGYNTLVGERGMLLSGGQKQRVAIARAFLRNAPIIILDEATSALDSESEEKIQLALKELMRGKTVLIIAHRFSTIRDATKILVFEKGQIVDQGDHDRLYSECPLYRALYDRQR